MNENVYYFGYGANKDPKRIELITGHRPTKGYSATLDGYSLCIQTLDQIPNPAREMLREVWGDEFRAYTVQKGKGQVSGIVWEMSQEDKEKMEEWEFANTDQGENTWKEIIMVPVKTSEGVVMNVYTDCVPPGHPVKEVVDGLNYVVDINEGLKKPTREKEDDIYRIEALRETRNRLMRENSSAQTL